MSEEKTLGEIAYETWCYDISHDAWQAVADAVVAAHEARRWNGISTAPKDGTIIDLWVYWPNRDIAPQRITDGFWNEVLQVWSSLRAYDTGFVTTHWTPLPAPPKEADHGE